MHPIVIIFLLFAGMGALYFFAQQQSGPIAGVIHSIRSAVGLTDGQILLIVELIAAVAVVWTLINWFNTWKLERDANRRFKDSINQPADSQYLPKR